MTRYCLFSIVLFASLMTHSVVIFAESWRGLKIAPESRCSGYDKKRDYPYPQSVEQKIISEQLGGRIYGPYTGSTFSSARETDIEHIVATSEAHDSGLCAASAEVKKAFARDILNLTLASPGVNRHQKSGKDAYEWLPKRNQCWFADRILQVRQKYNLTIDRKEADTLESVLSRCDSVEMVFYTKEGAVDHAPVPISPKDTNVLSLYDDNKNGRITCAEAKRHGIAPVSKEHPAYPFMNDRDGDGVVCE